MEESINKKRRYIKRQSQPKTPHDVSLCGAEQNTNAVKCSVESKPEVQEEHAREKQIQKKPDIEVEGLFVQTDINKGYIGYAEHDYMRTHDSVKVEKDTVRQYKLRYGMNIKGLARFNGSGQYELYSVSEIDRITPEKRNLFPQFEKLVPYFPDKRIFLETDKENMTGRIIDLVTPLGRGQRGLIVAGPRVGKTVMLKSIANSVIKNCSDVKLMILLVDERPEEVTDMKESVPEAEVFSSTFDEEPNRHVKVAETVIERAKRLVETGKDVIILLDSITRLARAYNTVQPRSGRVLSGGMEAEALRGPKKFFGAARNIKGGGSLTILGTALVDTGSKMDEVIFEEFKGTGNMELHLDEDMADQRIYPAIDIKSSGTRKEDLLTHPDELPRLWKLRREMNSMNKSESMKKLISVLRKFDTNTEFLLSVRPEEN